MSWVPSSTPTLNPPNLADYVSWLTAVLPLPATYGKLVSNLVTDSQARQVTDSSAAPVTSNPVVGMIQISLNIALDIVNTDLSGASQDIYTLAVYNLAADRLINFGMDNPPDTFFSAARVTYGINSAKVGIVSSASDEGTSVSLMNPETFAQFTMLDLQNMKTPWGRNYIGLAQAYGSNLWGLS